MITVHHQTLNAVLDQLGYTTQPALFGAKRIVDANGVTVFSGIASSVWNWLYETKQARRSKALVREMAEADLRCDELARIAYPHLFASKEAA